MTIRKGEEWGYEGSLEPGAQVITATAESHRLLSTMMNNGWKPGEEPLIRVGLTGGDMHQTLGAPVRADGGLYEHARVYPMDILVVESGGKQWPALCHVVGFEGKKRSLFGSPLWKTRTFVAMNSSLYGNLVLGPKGHPNDGRLEVTDGFLPKQEHRQGLYRARSGTHFPHPTLTHTRPKQRDVVSVSGKPLEVYCDGVSIGKFTEFHVEVIADALEVVA